MARHSIYRAPGMGDGVRDYKRKGMKMKTNTSFEKPIKVTDVEMAFPASVGHLMPAYKDIPEEFKGTGNPYVRWQQKWFYQGLKSEDIPNVKEGIDMPMALRHLSCIQRSFEPQHEHKEAAVAYLASLWFEEP